MRVKDLAREQQESREAEAADFVNPETRAPTDLRIFGLTETA